MPKLRRGDACVALQAARLKSRQGEACLAFTMKKGRRMRRPCGLIPISAAVVASEIAVRRPVLVSLDRQPSRRKAQCAHRREDRDRQQNEPHVKTPQLRPTEQA